MSFHYQGFSLNPVNHAGNVKNLRIRFYQALNFVVAVLNPNSLRITKTKCLETAKFV
jgi:hypothetical protein